MRLTDCVPYDDASLERLRALRDRVRAEFARHGGPGSADHWTREWNSAWLLADDWSPVVGDDGMIGLDSPSKNMAALIPEAWARPATGTQAGGYDPVAEVEATRAAITPWAPNIPSEATFFTPVFWDVRVSSPSKLGEGNGPMARFYF